MNLPLNNEEANATKKDLSPLSEKLLHVFLTMEIVVLVKSQFPTQKKRWFACAYSEWNSGSWVELGASNPYPPRLILFFSGD